MTPRRGVAPIPGTTTALEQRHRAEEAALCARGQIRFIGSFAARERQEAAQRCLRRRREES